MAAMDPECTIYRDFAAEVLANILTRLPPNTRRRLRLVCRHWRDVVGTRTATNLRSRAKTLVAAWGSTYVFGDLSASRKPLWADHRTSRRYEGMSVVGTCNGLVCLYDDREIGDTIVVANPVTGEALSVPPLPLTRAVDRSRRHIRTWRWAYSFAYLPTSGRYKVVHVPSPIGQFVSDAVHVFMLGEASWGAVPAGRAARCNDLDYSVVSVDGVTYWSTPEGAEKVFSFELEHERVTPITSLPYVLSDSENGGGWQLAEVHGRLAIVFSHASPEMSTTQVWVMEGATGQVSWSLWYIVQMSTPSDRPGKPPNKKIKELTWPLFVHGEHILTWETEWPIHRGYSLCMHTPIHDTRKAKHGMLDISKRNRGMVATNFKISIGGETFAYVETEEPHFDDLEIHFGVAETISEFDGNIYFSPN
ncbi:hypothetical protein VPH35_135642 [Triticum aestivum]